MSGGQPKNQKRWKIDYSRHKERYILKDKRIRLELPEIYAIYNRNKYLKRKYNLSTMYPCKKAIWRLEKLMEDLESTKNMDEIDLKYWEQLKPKLEDCRKLVEIWRQEYILIKGKNIVKNTTRKNLMEEMPQNARI